MLSVLVAPSPRALFFVLCVRLLVREPCHQLQPIHTNSEPTPVLEHRSIELTLITHAGLQRAPSSSSPPSHPPSLLPVLIAPFSVLI